MMTLLVSFAAVNMAFMPVLVLLPFFVRDILQRGPEWYGFLLAASGSGALIGSSGAAIVMRAVGRPRVLIALCLGLLASALLVLAQTTRERNAFAALAVVGTMSSIINVIVVTTFQSRSASEMRGRVMALVMGLSSAAVPVGMIAGGLIGDAWRGSIEIVYTVCGSAIGGVALTLARNRWLTEDPERRDAIERGPVGPSP